ncbi:hypothetical protein CRM22_006757 [Opisthorchis felineus]|uniref:MD-2-related lipid-recognition domain-containing protein n=1 Tax=Opisthorchis felineus TaxID=147828 RepID=A0A4S2LJE2_OPIFE|nr:hypothetical protein CRM22_006757 [Opisthorchis felineus]
MQVQHTLLLVTTTVVLVGARDVAFTDCDSRIPVKSVSVIPCHVTPCELTRGDATTFRIQFQADETTGSLSRAEVYAVVGGVAVPFALDVPEICGNVHPDCPLQAGLWYTYKKYVYIPSTHSQIDFSFRWILKNSFRQPVVCVEIPVRIV